VALKIGLYSEDRSLQSVLASALGKDFQVFLSVDETGIKQLLEAGGCDVTIVDLDSSHKSALDRIGCCRRILEVEHSPVVVIMADDAMRTTANELVKLGAYGYLRRPPSIRDLKTMLLRAHETSSLKRRLNAVEQTLHAGASCDRMIGSSPQMQEIYDLVRRVSSINASVLVTGESGTGKELIANAIHRLGGRASQPFIAVSCGAIPETLIEAELFGHEKGAFTGTVGCRVGFLEQAAEGTLFLDEIGDLSLATQVKLLRVLQQREFSRLGSTRLIPLRARLIFATHRDLGEMVAQGTFRQDLYYRINVMRIHAPALQERRDDIREIAMHFLRHYSELYEKTMVSIDADALTALESYPWPGNVRELENVVQRAIIMARTGFITLDDLPAHIQEAECLLNIEDYQAAGSFERQIRDYKIKLAVNAVREHNGNKTLAARSLQISRAYLHRLLRSAGSELPTEPEQSKLELA
jgi:DNA-binding NtrC family response regulator